MPKLECVECGKAIDKDWAKEDNIGIPLCRECYAKAKQRFEELIPGPAKFVERCNLR